MQKSRSSATYDCTHWTWGASWASAAFDLAAAPRSCSSAIFPAFGIPRSITNLRIFHSFFRSEEHTSELQSLMRISYAVFCLKKKNKKKNQKHRINNTIISKHNDTH